MRTILHEAKKMFLYQKGFLFLGLFLALTIFTIIFFDTPANADMKLYSGQYHHYLKSVQGKLTPQSDAILQGEAENLSKAQIDLDKLYEDFYDGKLNKNELAEKAAYPETILENRKGFAVIYEQYTYVRESESNRFLMDTNGWDALLSNENLDFLLLLTLLLLVTPVFCNEYFGKMYSLILTQKLGARHTAVCKMWYVMGLTVLLCVFTFGVKYLFYSAVYGLCNGHFPLQSLPYFATSTKNISLTQTFICISVCKTFGFAAFSMLIMAVSVFVKKYPLTLFLCTAVILLPYIGLGGGAVKYYLPPLGFMLATGFFRGSETCLDGRTGQPETRFAEIPSSLFWILLTVTLILGLILYLAISHCYTNAWSTKKHRSRTKAMGLLLAICVLSCSLTGCAPFNDDIYDIYNVTSKDTFENEKYLFSVEYGSSKTDIVFEDRKSGKIQSLIMSPMKSMTEIEDALYGNGQFVYYAKHDIDKSGLKPQIDRFSIVEVDTEGFNEKIVFEKKISENESGIMGIKTAKELDRRFFVVHAFFMDKQHIFIVCDGEIMQINRITGSVRLIPITAKGNIAYDGRHLYYIDEKYQIIKHDTQNNSKVILENAVVEQFFLTDKEILYRNRQDNDKIYGMTLDGVEVYKISDKSVLSVRGNEQYLYFTDSGDLKEYRMDRDGGNIVLLSD